ncbi:MAG: sodium:solute symporter [Planctomycetes bacterium]|nr:sodium:solute symporter [Planctomycetota bacterium]
MSTVDWIVFAAFIAYVVWDGMRRTAGSKDLEGYYAGNRSIPWWAAGLSIMATQASAITVIGTTGQGHEGGLGFVQFYFGLPFAMVLLCIFLVPLYRKRAILTPYEYLEGRFGPATRALAGLIFLASRCLALGVVIYAPAVALSAMIGLETWQSVLVIGTLTTLYTVVGGIAAVVWTDVKQMTVILLGLGFVCAILLWDLLPQFGFGQLLDLAGAAGKLNAVEVLPAHTGLVPRLLDEGGEPSFWEYKYTLWSGLIGGLFLQLSYFGCDHSQAQRLLTSRDVGESRKSLLLSAFAKVPMQTFVLFLGVLMWLFYALNGQPMLYKSVHVERAASAELAPIVAPIQAEFDAALAVRTTRMKQLAALPGGPDSDPALLADYQRAVADVAAIRQRARIAVSAPGLDGKPRDEGDTNDIFCRFILDQLPPVILGLVIAAIFAAAMSSIDSVLNALSAATIVDYYRRWLRPRCSERHAVTAGRIVTLFWGVVSTGMALWLGGGGSVIERINQVGSFFYGSLLGIFALALFVRRAGELAGVLGLLSGMGAVLILWQTVRIEYLWFNVVGCLVVLAVGWLVSRITPAPPPRSTGP